MISRWRSKSTSSDPEQPSSSSSNNARFNSPASTSLDELVKMREQANALRRNSRRKSMAPAHGPSVSKKLGRGLDFAEVREYQAGDDVRMIDWKVTARTGNTHTKLFVEERERPVMLVVDFRSHMRFGTQGMFKSVMAARLSALLGWTAHMNQDRVGGFVFTDDWHTEIRPRTGRRGLMNLFQGIHQAQMHAPSGDKGQLSDTLARLHKVVHTGSTVIVLSDFIGFDDNAKLSMGNLLQRLDIQAVHIVDPMEVNLPAAGKYPIKGMHEQAEKSLSIDTAGHAQTKHYLTEQAKHRQSVAEFFTGYGHLYVRALTNLPLHDIALDVLQRRPYSRSATKNDDSMGIAP